MTAPRRAPPHERPQMRPASAPSQGSQAPESRSCRRLCGSADARRPTASHPRKPREHGQFGLPEPRFAPRVGCPVRFGLQSGRKWDSLRAHRTGVAGLLPPSHPGPPSFQGTTLAFRGTFDHTLDAKNRLTVPARYRAAYAEGVVLAAGARGLRRDLAPGGLRRLRPPRSRARARCRPSSASSSASSPPTRIRSSSTGPAA